MGISGVASPFLPFSASCRGPNETSLGPGSALGEKEEKNRRRRKKKVGERSEVSLPSLWLGPLRSPIFFLFDLVPFSITAEPGPRL